MIGGIVGAFTGPMLGVLVFIALGALGMSSGGWFVLGGALYGLVIGPPLFAVFGAWVALRAVQAPAATATIFLASAGAVLTVGVCIALGAHFWAGPVTIALVPFARAVTPGKAPAH